MPLNSLPPTVDPAALAAKRAAAAGRCHVDVGFWGGAIPGNAAQLGPLHGAGVLGFKCFLLPSGVDEFPPLSPAELEADLAIVAALGSQLIVHAEDPHVIERAPEAAGRDYGDVPAVPPGEAENLADRAGARPGRADRRAGAHPASVQRGGVRPDPCRPGAGACRSPPRPARTTWCSAPKRYRTGRRSSSAARRSATAANRERLWSGLADGTIDCVVSDHSPCTPELKRLEDGDFGAAWGGIASLQLGLPAVWTQARARGLRAGAAGPVDGAAPGGDRRAWAGRARIEPGRDADFCVLRAG